MDVLKKDKAIPEIGQMIKCKNCSKKIHTNEGCYNTPMGIYCIDCYDKKIKEAKIIMKKKL